MSEGRFLRLLPVACLAAAVVLFASELMTTFEFTPPGAEPICDQGGADRHGNALALLAVFAIGALAITVFAGSKPAAIAVAACGGIALLFFLLLDLPDANAVGTINDSCGSVGSSFFDAEAVPQGGFFLEMIGALGLTITGLALATLTPEQLAALRPNGRGAAVSHGEPSHPRPDHEAADAEARRLRRRPRSRQRG
jgi:hypothetical protein